MRIPLLLIAASFVLSSANAQDSITIEFNKDSVTFGTLNSTEYNALDETPAPDVASFTISDISGPDLVVSINATGEKINLLTGGLADGSSGFNSSGEGFTLSFNRSVTLVSLDWGSFSDLDEGSLSFTMDGVDPIQVSESDATWGSAQTDVQNIGLTLSPEDSVTLSHVQGDFILQGLTIETIETASGPSIPEPSVYSGLLGLFALIALFIKRSSNN